jgi:predicted alpha/beta hydrolase
MDLQHVATASGYKVPLYWYPAPGEAPTLVVMAALGTPCRKYENLASALNAQGLNVALIEQRGQDKSALRASRQRDWGFADVLTHDLPAVFDWIEEQVPGAPLYLLGHSLGGHYACMMAGLMPERIAGVIVVATGSPWYKAYPPKMRRQIRLLIALLPLIMRLCGYYPGKRLGFGDRDARTLMRDWLDMARSNTYRARGLDRDLDAAMAEYEGPVLSIRLAEDPFAPEAAMRAVTDKFRRASVTKRVITADELGDKADHFRWAKRGTVVAESVAEWLRG